MFLDAYISCNEDFVIPSKLRCGTTASPSRRVHGRKNRLQYWALYTGFLFTLGRNKPSMTTTSGRRFRTSAQAWRKTPGVSGGNKKYVFELDSTAV